MIQLLLAKIGIKGAVIAALIATISIYVVVIRIENGHLTAKLDKSQQDVVRLNGLLAADHAALDEQQQGMKTLEAANSDLQSRIKLAGVQIDSLSKKSALEQQRIRTVTIPKDCDGAVSWLAAEAPGIVAKWSAK